VLAALIAMACFIIPNQRLPYNLRLYIHL